MKSPHHSLHRNLEDYTFKELKLLAKEEGYYGLSGLRKDELIYLLRRRSKRHSKYEDRTETIKIPVQSMKTLDFYSCPNESTVYGPDQNGFYTCYYPK